MSNVLQHLFNWAELVGTVAFAASGAMLAIDRELDLFGVLFLGVITAVGGGITRDVILGILPPSAFINSVYVAIAFVASLAVFLYAYKKGRKYWERRKQIDRIINFLDAVGLGIFSVVGTGLSMNLGYADNAFLCVFMGMTTGVGGGVLRDLLSQTVPAVLKKRIYAVASILGSLIYYIDVRTGIPAPSAMLSGMIVTIIIRMLSTIFVWDLPIVHKMQDQRKS